MGEIGQPSTRTAVAHDDGARMNIHLRDGSTTEDTRLGRLVEAARGVAAAFIAVGVSGLALFITAEWLAPTIPLWEPVGVSMVLGVAVYVLLPELGLCLATYELVRGARRRPLPATVGGIIAIPFMYLGMLATSYQFLG